MRLCDLDEIKIRVERQYKDCHGYSGNKKAIYREAILAVKSILHSAKPIDAVPVIRCKYCKYHEDEEIGMVYCPNVIGGWVGENWFCADGEREGGAD